MQSRDCQDYKTVKIKYFVENPNMVLQDKLNNSRTGSRSSPRKKHVNDAMVNTHGNAKNGHGTKLNTHDIFDNKRVNKNATKRVGTAKQKERSTVTSNGTTKCNNKCSSGRGAKLRLLVSRQDHTKLVAFVMRTTMPMQSLIQRYSTFSGIPVEHLRFLFDGNRISEIETPQTLNLKENDILEVYKFAIDVGGKCYFKLISD